MKTIHQIAVLTILLANPAAANGPAPEQPPSTGLLLTFELRHDQPTLMAAAFTNNTPIGAERISLRAAGRGDWRVVMVDQDDRLRWSQRIRHPRNVGPIEDSIAFALEIPILDNLEPTSSTISLQDSAGKEVWRSTLDALFAVAPDPEVRARQLREDQQRFATWKHQKVRREPIPFAYSPPRGSRFDRLPETVRQAISSEIGAELEIETIGAVQLRKLAKRGWLPATGNLHEFLEQQPFEVPSGIEWQPKSGTVTLDGSVRDAESGDPVADAFLSFYGWDQNGVPFGLLGTQYTSASGTYSQQVPLGTVLIRLEHVLSGTYVALDFELEISGDQTFDIDALAGVVLSGVVRNDEGQGLPQVYLNFAEPSSTWRPSVLSGADGSYQTLVPRNLKFSVGLHPQPPYFRTFHELGPLVESSEIDFELPRGWLLDGTIHDVDGAPVEFPWGSLRHLATSTSANQSSNLATLGDGTFRIAVNPNLSPADYVLSVFASGFVRKNLGLSLTGDSTVHVTLERGFEVSGQILGHDGFPATGIVVRAFREEEFITSYITRNSGTYSFALAPGTYRFEVVHPTNDYFPLTEDVVVGDQPVSRDFTMSLAAGNAIFELVFPSSAPQGLLTTLARFEVWRNQTIVASTLGASFGQDSQTGRQLLRHTIFLEPGTHDVVAHLNGYEPIRWSNISGDSAVHRIELPTPYTWKGRLRNADGEVLPNRAIVSRDNAPTTSTWSISGLDGTFELPLMPGGFIKAQSPESGDSIPYIERLDRESIDSREHDLVLDELPRLGESGEMVELIWGDSDSDRYTLAIIGDGYTDVIETFTDTNMNGVWDGTIFYDLNGNDLWDLHPRYGFEPIQLYGNAPLPELDTDPTLGNEPFTDLNGDGFPNLDDQALFDRQSRAVLRALFGSDFFADHRDTFDVYRARAISNQAGHDVYGDDGELLWERDTRFDTRVSNPSRSYILGMANANVVFEFVNQHVPQADATILLFNQPVNMGRATSFITATAGPNARIVNDNTNAHEMGHKFGRLQDEYIEFDAHYSFPESPFFSNVTTLTERHQIPWSELIPDHFEVPTPRYTGGTGLFEGAQYHTGGAYRPSQNCLMGVGSDWFCDVCSRLLHQQSAALFGGPAGELELIRPQGRIDRIRPVFEWNALTAATHYEIELHSSGELVGSWMVYDSSWSIGFDLELDTAYRWRLRAMAQETPGTWSPWVDFETFSGSLEAGFSWSPESVLAGQAVLFSDTSLGERSSWHWDFGDGNQSSVAHPEHVYVQPGDYPVTLTVTSHDQSDTTTQVVSVGLGDVLSVQGGRFLVEAQWRDFGGQTGTARVVPYSSEDSGMFWFFDANNWEMLVKVLDGCSFNQHFWVFSAATTDVEYTLTVTDTATGVIKEYFNPLGTAAAAITDTMAFSTCDENVTPASDAISTAPVTLESLLPAKGTECGDGPFLCLDRGRFRVAVDWRDFNGQTGSGQVVPFGSDDSGLFWFFGPDNWEMLVKVLDGCGFNDRFWIFAAATTDVEYTLTVTDTITGAAKEYFNPLGRAAAAITDTDALATCQ